MYDWPNKRPTTFKDFIFFTKLAKKYKPAIVLCHFGAVNICVMGAALLGIRSYAFYHTLTAQIALDTPKSLYAQYRSKLLTARKQFIYRLSHRIVAGTVCAKKDIQDTWHIAGRKIEIAYYGLPDTPIRNNYQQLKIGFVGRMDYSKGIDILINAVGKLINRNFDLSLEIVGSGEWQAELENLVRSNGWENRILFLGRFPYEKIHQFIASNYLMVLPSRIDNPSVVIMESFATQTPIIGSGAGAIPEIIQHKKNGLLFQSENADDLALQIESLLNDKILRDRLAAAGRKSYEENYTIDKYIQRITALF